MLVMVMGFSSVLLAWANVQAVPLFSHTPSSRTPSTLKPSSSLRSRYPFSCAEFSKPKFPSLSSSAPVAAFAAQPAKTQAAAAASRETIKYFFFIFPPSYLPKTHISPTATLPSLRGARKVIVMPFTSISLKSRTRLLPANISCCEL